MGEDGATSVLPPLVIVRMQQRAFTCEVDLTIGESSFTPFYFRLSSSMIHPPRRRIS
jgi:hypothetical protein